MHGVLEHSFMLALHVFGLGSRYPDLFDGEPSIAQFQYSTTGFFVGQEDVHDRTSSNRHDMCSIVMGQRRCILLCSANTVPLGTAQRRVESC